MIFCPTAPQSGTWFVLRFFERLGFRIEHTGVITREQKTIDISVPTILHCHVFPFYYIPQPYKESWPSFGGDPIEEHIVRKDKLSIYAIQLLASMHKTVIPIRDPLASLLTRENRAPNLRHFYIVDAYVEIARKLAPLPNVFFLPVDLKRNYQERKECLIEMLVHCNISPAEHMEEVEKTAKEWKRENVTPNNKFYAMYHTGDIRGIEALLGQKVAELTHLRNMSGFLAPFLGSLGYNARKTLIW